MSTDHLLSTSPRKADHGSGLHIYRSRARTPSIGARPTPARSLSAMSFRPASTSHHDDVTTQEETTPLMVSSKVAGDLEERRGSEGEHTWSVSILTSLETALHSTRQRKLGDWMQLLKVIVLIGIAITCCVVVVSSAEQGDDPHEIIVTDRPHVISSWNGDDDFPIQQLILMGPIFESTNDSNRDLIVTITDSNDTWFLAINQTADTDGDMAEFQHNLRCPESSHCNISLRLVENRSVALVYILHPLSSQLDNEIIYAGLILFFVYVLIIFELVHRTLAAMLGSLAAMAVLSVNNERPITEKVVGWIEMETLMLLFGMMIIVAMVSETGIFDFMAVKAYKLAKGKVWPLITWLCAFSAVVSAFLDNVTTILLMAPVTIKLCEVLNLEPQPVLIAEVLFSNIGGTATAIGDPPNVIIVGTLESYGIKFAPFTLHLFVGVLFTSVFAYGFLRLYYRNQHTLANADPPEIAELHHEIQMFRRASLRLVVVTREETVMKALFLQKIVQLENQLNNTQHRQRRAERKDFDEQLRQLERECRIKDVWLLVKCGCVLVVVIVFFFMYSFVTDIHVGLGWIAVLGAILLLVIADVSDLENVLHKVEWSTLLFFAALFILMEALVELHLMEWIGDGMLDMITAVNSDYRLLAAVVIIVWVSALVSSVIDNIPFTTAMIPVLKQLSDDDDVNLDLLPLTMALAFGACLGGNGTLIGASANVVCAGIAEQHGYPIDFRQFFKIGFPMMLVTTFVATIYLIICHVAIEWNSADM